MTAYTLAGDATLRDIGNAGIWGVATARNLARNLSRMAQLDGEASFSQQRSTVSVGRFSAAGRADARWRGTKAALVSGYRFVADANGFASWKHRAALNLVFRFSADGNGFAQFAGGPTTLVGGGRAPGEAEGVAHIRPVVISTTTKAKFFVRATRNPSDEELVAIATSLTKKKLHGTYPLVR